MSSLNLGHGQIIFMCFEEIARHSRSVLCSSVLVPAQLTLSVWLTYHLTPFLLARAIRFDVSIFAFDRFNGTYRFLNSPLSLILSSTSGNNPCPYHDIMRPTHSIAPECRPASSYVHNCCGGNITLFLKGKKLCIH